MNGKIATIHALVADDAMAASFQTMGSYRSALLKGIRTVDAAQNDGTAALHHLTGAERLILLCLEVVFSKVPATELTPHDSSVIAALRRTLKLGAVPGDGKMP